MVMDVNHTYNHFPVDTHTSNYYVVHLKPIMLYQ